jgi:hypothetical protein
MGNKARSVPDWERSDRVPDDEEISAFIVIV